MARYVCYCYPTPDDFAAQAVRPSAAFFDDDAGEFLLPYDVVRRSEHPDRVLMDFLQSTYEAAANTGDWNRDELECALGVAGEPRTSSASRPGMA